MNLHVPKWIALVVRSHSQYRIVKHYYLDGSGCVEFFVPEMLVSGRKILPLPRNMFARTINYPVFREWSFKDKDIYDICLTGGLLRDRPPVYVPDREILIFREALISKSNVGGTVAEDQTVIVVKGPLSGQYAKVLSIDGPKVLIAIQDSLLQARIVVPLSNVSAVGQTIGIPQEL